MLQKIFKILFFSLMLLCCVSLIASCAQSPKGYTVADPAYKIANDLIIESDNKIKIAYEKQWDVLAQNELNKCVVRVEKAKKYYSQGDSINKIMDVLQDFEKDYNEAKTIAEARTPNVKGLLLSRQRVLDSDVQNSPDLSKLLYKLDQRFRRLVEKKTVYVYDFSNLYSDYVDLSQMATRDKYLSKAREQISFAIKNKARRYAPKTLNKAELDIKTAENVIRFNLDNPGAYEAAVEQANHSATRLAAVVGEQKRVNFKLDEMAAITIVRQRESVARLDTDLRKKNEELYYSEAEKRAYQNELENTREEIKKREQELAITEQEIQKKEAELARAEKEKRFEMAIDFAQKQFSKNEADVYRQGDKLLIRLKKIEFPAGKTIVPDKSKQLLDKVASVAKQLSPQLVVVEGHTDSIGSVELNSMISQGRADSVRDYLENEGIPKSIIQSEGYGFEKPLSTNKTQMGRAQNRRVDIWITPSAEIKATE